MAEKDIVIRLSLSEAKHQIGELGKLPASSNTYLLYTKLRDAVERMTNLTPPRS